MDNEIRPTVFVMPSQVQAQAFQAQAVQAMFWATVIPIAIAALPTVVDMFSKKNKK